MTQKKPPETGKPAKKQTGQPPEKQENSGMGEFDVEVEYSLKLKKSDGEIARVGGRLPLDNALIPAFLKDSMNTIGESVEKLVLHRFMLQVRNFFNARMEAGSPEHGGGNRALEDGGGKGVSVGDSPAEAPSPDFGFESDSDAD